jgi:hypothetical protein
LVESSGVHSALSGVTFGVEAGQGFILGVEGGDQVQQPQEVERQQCTTSRPYKPQVAAPIPKADAYFDDNAEAGTIYVAQVRKIQQDLARAVADQLFQSGSQEFTLTIADGSPSLKVQDGDIAGSTN